MDRQACHARTRARRSAALPPLRTERSCRRGTQERGPAVSTSEFITSARALGDKEERILRYSLTERINHWTGGLSYIYCLGTGLAFWSPYLYLLGGGGGG